MSLIINVEGATQCRVLRVPQARYSLCSTFVRSCSRPLNLFLPTILKSLAEQLSVHCALVVVLLNSQKRAYSLKLTSTYIHTHTNINIYTLSHTHKLAHTHLHIWAHTSLLSHFFIGLSLLATTYVNIVNLLCAGWAVF